MRSGIREQLRAFSEEDVQGTGAERDDVLSVEESREEKESADKRREKRYTGGTKGI